MKRKRKWLFSPRALENLLVAQHRQARASFLAGLFNTAGYRRAEQQALDKALHWLDYMRLRVERQAGISADSDAGLARAIGEEMHKRIMARINVEIVDPGTLPRTFSKAKRITELRLND